MTRGMWRRARLPLASLLLSLLLAVSSAQLAAAQTPSLLQQLQSKIRQAQQAKQQVERQRDVLGARVGEARGREYTATQQLRAVETAIYATLAELSRNERRMQEVQLQVYDLTHELQEREAVAQTHLQGLAGRMRMMYRLSRTSLIEQVLGAKSFHDVLQRLSMMQTLAREDQRVVQWVRNEQQQLGKKREELAAREQEIRELRAQIEEQKRQLDLQRAERERVLRAVQAERAQLEEAYTETDQKAREYESLIRQYEQSYAAELRRLEEERRRREEEERRRREAAQRGGQAPIYTEPSRVSAAGLAWPIASRVLTTRFGESTFAQRFHTGIDVAAPIGTPVVAAADGVVAVAGLAVPGNPRGSYGLHVVLLHGNGLSTLYAHLDLGRGLPVSVGQTVRQGQVIGYVGMTGITSGPHLHFETRVNGSFRDPLGLLP